jgi:hypothetical protein
MSTPAKPRRKQVGGKPAAAPTKRTAAPGTTRNIGDGVAFTVMMVAVLAVYLPSEYGAGTSGLRGADHLVLHMRRMAFALEHLMGKSHVLPGWYPHELLGTPFWSNLQNFPFLPTRLLVLLLAGPVYAMTAGAMLAALLAAAFTYFFCRRIDFSPMASATAGWTFACAGFFASRLLAGHLPVLEAYPSCCWRRTRCGRVNRPDHSPGASCGSAWPAPVCHSRAIRNFRCTRWQPSASTCCTEIAEQRES